MTVFNTSVFGKLTWYHFAVLLILITAIIFRCYRFSEKETMYGDEFVTLVLSSYSDYGVTKIVNTGEVGMTGKEIKSLVFSDDSSLKNIAMDIWALRTYPQDPVHGNLYYSFVRLTQLNLDTSDLPSVMYRCFLLNMFFFLLSFVFFIKILDLLISDQLIKILVLSLAFLLPVSIANTLFFREYQLQETMLVVFTFFYVKFSLQILHKDQFLTLGDIFLFALTIALAILSGYLGVFYMLALGVTMILLMLYKKYGLKEILRFSSITILALLFLLIIYPSVFVAFKTDRGEGILFGLMHGDSLSYSLGRLYSEVGMFYVYLPLIFIIFILGIVLLRKKILTDDKFFVAFTIVFFCLLWVVIVMCLAPYKHARYIVAAFPMLSLFPIFLLGYISWKKLQRALIAVSLLLVIMKTIKTEDVYWGNINIYDNYKKYLDIPLLTNNLGITGLDATLTPHYADDRMIYITFGQEAFDAVLEKHEEICVMVADLDKIPPKGYRVAEEIFSKGEWPFAYFRLVKE